jgi:hypothetical protein
MAEVELALRAGRDGGEEAPDEECSFVERVKTAPSLSEEQRRRWLALLAAGPT